MKDVKREWNKKKKKNKERMKGTYKKEIKAERKKDRKKYLPTGLSIVVMDCNSCVMTEGMFNPGNGPLLPQLHNHHLSSPAMLNDLNLMANN